MLIKQLLELKDKIDEDYAARIDDATNMSSVDDLEKRAIERSNTIDCVIQWAENYGVLESPTAADTLAKEAEWAFKLAEQLVAVAYRDEVQEYLPAGLMDEVRAWRRRNKLDAALRQYREATK